MLKGEKMNKCQVIIVGVAVVTCVTIVIMTKKGIDRAFNEAFPARG